MKAVILAGGEGSRLRPMTYSRPKVMIPVANIPIIEYVIDALLSNGIRDISVVVGYRREQVIRHLNQLDESINVILQEKQLGAAHALKCAESVLEDDFLLLPGDNYIDSASIAKIKDSKNAMLVKDHPYPSNFGVVLLKDDHVIDIIEKPLDSPSFTVSTGIFALTPEIFDFLDGKELPEAVTSMIATRNVKIRAVFAEEWHDAVYPWDLLSFNAQILRHLTPQKSGKISGNVLISGPVRIGEGTRIGPNTTIEGPVIIGDNCTIGPNACISPNTSIGSRVHVEPFTVLGNSLILDDVTVGSHSRIVDSVIGEGTRLLDHTSTCTGVFTTEEEGKLIKGKFGVIIGDRVHSAPFTVFDHCMIGNNVTIDEGRTLKGLIPDHVVVK
jgi:UDP-N-acetylglucosamine diphosphorylase/glucosamine-1-phosphate N-acetyltransferase